MAHPRAMTETERAEFLAEPRVAVLAINADGDDRPPLTVPVWYHYTPDDDLTFFTNTDGSTSRKTRLLERAGGFSLNVQHAEMPYRYVTVECTITDTDRKPTFAQAHAIISRYLPDDMARGMAEQETADPDNPFVLYTARPDRWITGTFG